MFTDSDLLPISALQHLVFCPRQCMLIHLEQAWAENRWTAEGRVLHERVHERQSGTEQGIPVARGLRLVSYRLGLSGMADFVEYHPAGDPPRSPLAKGGRDSDPPVSPLGKGGSDPDPPVSPLVKGGSGVELPGRVGRWVPFPVEYKRGRPKAHDADAVQLCAQALCLEEMLQTAVPAGALFYGATRRRVPIAFGAALRGRVEQLAARLHELFDSGITPPPEPGPKCKHCSLQDECLPERPASAAAFVKRMMKEASAGTLDPESPPGRAPSRNPFRT